jgi:hypothetical protein
MSAHLRRNRTHCVQQPVQPPVASALVAEGALAIAPHESAANAGHKTRRYRGNGVAARVDS